MADTRNPSGHPDNLSRSRSLLRRERWRDSTRAADKRPAGPSFRSDPGMGSPARPLPPGVKPATWQVAAAPPNVASSFRYDFELEPEEDPTMRRKPEDVQNESAG